MIELNVTNLVGGNIVITTSSSGGGSEIPDDWDGVKIRFEFSDESIEEYSLSSLGYETPDQLGMKTGNNWTHPPIKVFLGTCVKNNYGTYWLGTGTFSGCESLTEVTTLETISYWESNIYDLLDCFDEGITVHCTDGDFTLAYPS